MLGDLEKLHPSEPHYYLEFIGTDPAHQGKGMGTQLITPMVERCDTEGVPAYLESSNLRNVPFYARHGFEQVGRKRFDHRRALVADSLGGVTAALVNVPFLCHVERAIEAFVDVGRKHGVLR